MRISKEASEAKKNFVLGLLADNIELTNREVQEHVKKTFNQSISPNTVAELKKSLLKKDSPIVMNENPALDKTTVSPAENPGLNVIGTEIVTESEVKPLGELEPVAVPTGGTMRERLTVHSDGTIEIELRPGLVEVIKPQV